MDQDDITVRSPGATIVNSFDNSTLSSNNVIGSDNETNNNINIKSQSPKPSKVKHAPVHYTDDDYLPSTRVQANRVRPEMDTSLSNDFILLDILNILYDNESGNELENGFTVKQICDKLLEKDPKMIDLSTKFANLISAKINAYAKKVENRVRGDFNVHIKYWIIRKWAKGNSPKRMVYIYKGLLPDGYSETPPPTGHMGPITTKNSTSLKKTDTSSGVSQKKVPLQESSKKETAADNSKKISYNKLINSNGITKNSSMPRGSNKFSINLNRFQQFGYKNNTIIKNKSSNTNTQEKKKLQQQNVTSKLNTSIEDNQAPKTLISGTSGIGLDHSTAETEGTESMKNIDSAKIAQQIQLIQRSIQQISPVQRLTNAHHTQQSFSINRKWMETLKSGFMSEEILSPDNIKLSDFDQLFN